MTIRLEDLECLPRGTYWLFPWGWQEAASLATEIYEVSKEGEFGKDFGFRDQLRKAAVSIASNTCLVK